MSEIKRGTFCAVIGQQLIVSSCPLPKGSCMWKHRVTGVCTYEETEMTVGEFCAHVGLPQPQTEVVNNLRQQLRARLKAEL